MSKIIELTKMNALFVNRSKTYPTGTVVKITDDKSWYNNEIGIVAESYSHIPYNREYAVLLKHLDGTWFKSTWYSETVLEVITDEKTYTDVSLDFQAFMKGQLK